MSEKKRLTVFIFECEIGVVKTNITFQTGGYTSLNSMSILGSGDRAVEIHTNLNIKSPSTVMENGMSVGTAMSGVSTGLLVYNGAVINGNLTVGGNTILSGNTIIS